MEFEECEICGQWEDIRYMDYVPVFGERVWACFDCVEESYES